MKYCKSCKTYNPDYEDNCPLCGAGLAPAETTEEEFSFAPYNSKQKIKSAKKIVRDIFIVISIIILAGLFVASVLSKVWGIFYIGVASVGFFWLIVGQHVFFRTDLRSIYFKVAFWLIVLAFLVSLHYGVLYVAVSYAVPAILFVLNVTSLMTVFISHKWYRYAFHVFNLGLLMIGMLPLNYLLSKGFEGYNWIASTVTFGLGLITVLFSFIFGKDVLYSEVKKRFFF